MPPLANSVYGRNFCFRLVGYSLLVALTIQLVVLLVQNGYTTVLFSENGPLEWMQFSLAAFAGCWLLYLGSRQQPVLTVCGLLALYAAFRELDGLFDHLLFESSYKFVFGPPIAFFIGKTLWKHRKTYRDQLWKFTSTPSWAMLAVGFVTICLFAKIFGQKELWIGLMGDSYIRLVKNAVEESSELFGYLILFCGAIEARWTPRQQAAVTASTNDQSAPTRQAA